MITDAGLAWIHDPLTFDDRPWPESRGGVARGWKKWYQGAGEIEWNRVGAGRPVQEVRKAGVRVGLYRQNRGFVAGLRYRLSFKASNFTQPADGIPRAAIWIHPAGKDDYGFAQDGNVGGYPLEAEAIRGDWVALTAGEEPTEISYEFEAAHSAQTIFLAVDFEGVQQDGAVRLSDVTVESGSGNPRQSLPWMQDGSPPVEPPYIYGIHDRRGLELLNLYNQRHPDAPREGWVVHALAIGADPSAMTGQRFTEWVDGHGAIVRLSYQMRPNNDIPKDPNLYNAFASRCANFVQNSVGAGIWSIGNETPIESGASAEDYALCFCKCRDAIKAEDVRPGAQVISGGMMHGDPAYLRDVIAEIQRLRTTGQCGLGGSDQGLDGFAIHSYTGSLQWNPSTFRQFEDLLDQIPESMQDLPIYMTEAGSGATGQEYPDSNTGFIDRMFADVHQWNQNHIHKRIRSVNLFRWDWLPDDEADHWGIEHKPGMIEDFLSAMETAYYWKKP